MTQELKEYLKWLEDEKENAYKVVRECKGRDIERALQYSAMATAFSASITKARNIFLKENVAP